MAPYWTPLGEQYLYSLIFIHFYLSGYKILSKGYREVDGVSKIVKIKTFCQLWELKMLSDVCLNVWENQISRRWNQSLVYFLASAVGDILSSIQISSFFFFLSGAADDSVGVDSEKHLVTSDPTKEQKNRPKWRHFLNNNRPTLDPKGMKSVSEHKGRINPQISISASWVLSLSLSLSPSLTLRFFGVIIPVNIKLWKGERGSR